MRFVVQLFSSKQNTWVISAYTDHFTGVDNSQEACAILLDLSPTMFPKYRIVQLLDDEYYYQDCEYPVIAEYTREDMLHYRQFLKLPENFEVET